MKREAIKTEVNEDDGSLSFFQVFCCVRTCLSPELKLILLLSVSFDSM